MALSREPVPPSANPNAVYKTSVVFSLAEGVCRPLRRLLRW